MATFKEASLLSNTQHTIPMDESLTWRKRWPGRGWRCESCRDGIVTKIVEARNLRVRECVSK
jgi:hypothetical protein